MSIETRRQRRPYVVLRYAGSKGCLYIRVLEEAYRRIRDIGSPPHLHADLQA